MRKRIVNVYNERRMIPIKSKIENELHSYVLIGKSTAIIVRGRKDTDKIEYTIIINISNLFQIFARLISRSCH